MRTITIAALIVLMAASLASISFADASDWSTPVNLSNTWHMFSSGGSYDIDANGDIHLLFYDFEGDDYGVYYVTNQTGSWTKSVFVWYAKNPRLCITPDDVIHAFYTINGHLWEVTRPASGGSWSSPTQVDSTPSSSTPGELIVDSSGGIYITFWHLFDSSYNPVSGLYGKYKPLGGSWGPTELIYGTNHPDKWPMEAHLATYAGKIYCTYRYDGMFYKIRETNGSWGGARQLPYSGTIGAMDFSPDGELAAVYARNTAPSGQGLDYEVYCTVSGDFGNSWGAEICLSNSNWLSRGPIAAHYDQYSNLHVTWQRNDYDGEDFDMWYISRVGGVWQPSYNLTNNSGRTGAELRSLISDGDTLYYTFADNTYGDGFEELYITSKFIGLPPNSGTVTGTVYDNYSNRMSGATVTFSPGGYSATTDLNGNYIIRGIPAGTYTGTAHKQWYFDDTATGITITTGGTTTQDFTVTVDPTPPGTVPHFSATPSDGKVHIAWLNATDADVQGTVIRYRTDTFPTSPSDGTLLDDYSGGPGQWGLIVHEPLTNGQTIYYSAWHYDVHRNYSTNAKQVAATPTTAPFANVLPNAAINDPFTGGVADYWTGFTVNDPSGTLGFARDALHYESSPSQAVTGLTDCANAYDTGFSRAGVYETFSGATKDRVYLITGYQDIYNSSYEANSTMYAHMFGIDPYGETDAGTPDITAKTGGAMWLDKDMSFWNRSQGGSTELGGFHRVFASVRACDDTVTVYNGVTIRNDKTPDAVPTQLNADDFYVIEMPFSPNSTGTLVNGGFETATDLQNGGEILPDGWVPTGGGIGQVDFIDCVAFGARTGDRGLRIFNRRGCASKGMMQRLATQPGTPITFTAWAYGNEYGTQTQIGVDPSGGTDINSPDVVWSAAAGASWTQLTASTTADASYATVYLRMKNTDTALFGDYHVSTFDDASCSWTPAAATTGAVDGRVKDVYGNPLFDCTVSVQPDNKQTFTGTGGTYHLGGISPGTVSVTASLADYFPQTITGVSVTPGNSVTCKFDLDPRPSSIYGVVRDTLNNTIPGATVTVTPGNHTTTSASDGSYSITGLEPGTYDIVASKYDYGDDTETDIVIGPNDNYPVNFNLIPPPGTLQGNVYDHCGQPVANCEVRTNLGGYVTTTNASGYYEFTSITAGYYTVSAIKRDYSTEHHTNTFVDSYETTTLNFQLTGYDWTDHLTNGDFEGGFFGFWGGNEMPNGWGAAFTNEGNTAEWLSYTWGGTYGDTTRIKTYHVDTKAGIAQLVSGLPVGSPYRLGFDAYIESGYACFIACDQNNTGGIPGYETGIYGGTGDWQTAESMGTITNGGNLTVYLWAQYFDGSDQWSYLDNVYLETGSPWTCTTGCISGFVKDTSGNPLTGATVSTDIGGYSTTSASDGSYLLAGVAPDSYALTASKSPFDPQTVNGVTVIAGQTTEVDFSLGINPPDPVEDFTATGSDSTVTLTWTNPTSGNFASTMVRYSTSDFPSGPADGTLLCDKSGTPGSSDSFTHASLTNGLTYYYTAFATDGASEYSTPVYASAVPAASSTCGEAKLANSGTTITLSNKIVSAVFATDGYVYIQESDRSAGIKVTCDTTGLAAGDVITVTGTVEAEDDGGAGRVNYISATSVTETSTQDAPGPLAMTCRSVGGSEVAPNLSGVTEGDGTDAVGVNNIGLLVKVAGEVKSIAAGGFYIDDGSDIKDVWDTDHYVTGVLVTGDNIPSLSVGDFVSATGIVVRDVPAGWDANRRHIRTRAASDIYVYNAIPTTGDITGYVNDTLGSPIYGATVSTNTGGYSTTTATDGSYTLSGLSPDTYDVTAEKSGYQSQTVTGVVVTAGSTSNADFALAQQPMVEKLSNGDFEDGFFTFWGGSIGNSWGACWTADPFEDAEWASHYFDAAHGFTQEVVGKKNGWGAGVNQVVTGLTPGADYTFTAEAYRTYHNYSVWMLAYDGAGTHIVPSAGTGIPVVTDQWSSNTITGTVPASGTLTIYVWAQREWGDAYPVYLDNISLMSW